LLSALRWHSPPLPRLQIRNRWNELNANEQQELVALGFNYLRSGNTHA
jgi:hypothetical protein